MYILGFDIGGTKSAVILANLNDSAIEFLSRSQVDTSEEWQKTLDTLVELAKRNIKKQGLALSDIHAAGVSCGGPLNCKTGYILSPPNLIGWDNVPITSYLQERLGIKVLLKNDADACAIAEWKYGAGKGFNNIVFLTFGTGLGAGLILNGRLYTGASSMAGEVGHIRLSDTGPSGYGKRGSFEGFCSGCGVKQYAQNYAFEKLQQGQKICFCNSLEDVKNIDAKTVAEYAKQGDPHAIEIYQEVGIMFGKGLSILVDILNPDVIIAGSVYARNHEFMYESAISVMEKECLPSSFSAVQLLPAKLGEKIGDYATIVSALDW